MGKFISVGNKFWQELEGIDLSNIGLISETLTERPNYQRFAAQVSNDPAFWQQPGMRKKIVNAIEPHIQEFEMGEELLERLKREVARLGVLDQQIHEAELAAMREFYGADSLHAYRTFSLTITGALVVCPSIFDLMMKNFGDKPVILAGDAISIPVGKKPIGVHNAYNHLGSDNFHGIEELYAQKNYHFNLNTGGNYENQTPFVVWKNMEAEVQTPRYMVKYILENADIDERNRENLLLDLFAGENCWEATSNHTFTSAAVFNILNPTYLKARYCQGTHAENLEGMYALSKPNEAMVFSSGIMHSTNIFPPATEPRLSVIIRSQELDVIDTPDFQKCYLPGSNNSGVPLSDRIVLELERRKRVDHVWGNILGVEDYQRTAYQNALVPIDPYCVKAYKEHYEKAAPFLEQDELHLNDAGRQAIWDFFKNEAANRA